MLAQALLGFVLVASAAAQDAGPEQILKSAMASQDGGDYASAIQGYREFLKLRPNAVEARVNLGAALAHVGQYDAAIAQYQQALPEAAEKTGILVNLGLAYYKKGDLDHARTQFQTVMKSQPANAQVAILLGDTQLRLGDAPSAVKMLAPLAPANASNPDFGYVYGMALIRAGSARAGVELVQRAADTGHAADVYMLAGATLLRLNEFERARRDLDEALRLNPGLPGIFTLAGTARDRTGDVPAAEAAFREALKRNAQDFEANLYLGAILYKRGQLDDAKVYLDRAVAIQPRSAMARYEAGMLKSKSGQYEAALDDLKSAAAEDPSWLEPHVELASLYYKLKRPAEGLEERHVVDRLTAEQQAAGANPGTHP